MAIPYAPRDYYKPDNSRLIDILLQRGDIAARGAERSADNWAKTATSLGDIASGYFDQRHKDQQQERTIQGRMDLEQMKIDSEAPGRRMGEEKTRMELQKMQREEAESEGLKMLFQTGKMPTLEEMSVVVGPERAATIGKGLNILHPDGVKQYRDIKTLIRDAAQSIEATPEPLRQVAWSAMRDGLVKNAGIPDTEIPKEYSKEFLGAALAFGTKEDTTLSPTELALKAVRGDKEAKAAFGLMHPPSEGSMPSLQAKEVLDDSGRAVMATFNPKTGKYTGPDGVAIKAPGVIPTDRNLQDQNKFKKAAPVLSSISELSEKINTQQGLLAKMTGGASKLAAKANYDDDVAEYQALVGGFTPMVARAVGHTGVLTQQDVDSVRELFPKPGDSKSLRDRKIARVSSIMSELESGGAGGVVPPKAEAKPPEMVKYQGRTVPFKSLPKAVQDQVLLLMK